MKIEKGIPVPKGKTCDGSQWDAFEIGDSAFIDKPQSVVAGTVSNYKKATGRVFTTRKQGTGTRVWRIK